MSEIETQVHEYFSEEGAQQALAAVKAGDFKRLRKAARAWANKAWALPLLHPSEPSDAAMRMDARARLLYRLADKVEAGRC